MQRGQLPNPCSWLTHHGAARLLAQQLLLVQYLPQLTSHGASLEWRCQRWFVPKQRARTLAGWTAQLSPFRQSPFHLRQSVAGLPAAVQTAPSPSYFVWLWRQMLRAEQPVPAPAPAVGRSWRRY